MTTQLLAELVGPTGKVVGVDFIDAQLKQAQALLTDGHEHVEFVHASATATGLPPQSFDLVYSRFLLIHLVDPEGALKEMYSLLKPGGILVCEDGDLTSATSEPPSVLGKFSELWGRLGPKWGVDYTIGRRLYGLILKANFSDLQTRLNQPTCSHGDGKRLFELSVAEAGDAFITAGLISKTELENALAEMRSLTDDKTVLAILPRMTQVWGRKPLSAA